MKPGVKAGLIAGIASIAFHLVSYIANSDTDMSHKWMNYLFIALPSVVGVWFVKREATEGMSFSMGFKGGIQAALVCGVIYSIYFIFYIKFLRPEFMDLLMQMQTAELDKQNLPDEQYDQAVEMMKKFMNIPMTISMSLIMYAVFGAIVGAITSAILKNKTN